MTHWKVQLLASALVTLVSVEIGRARPPQRIIKGENASITDFPYQVHIEIKKKYQCGGTILDSMYILTAAHCLHLDVSPTSNEDIVVITGTSDSLYRPEENVFRVLESFQHPDYSGTKRNNDIAILKLSRPILFNDHQKAAALPTEDTPVNTHVTSTGWGVTTFDSSTNQAGPSSQYLQKLEKIVINHWKCRKLYITKLYSSQICALAKTEGDECYGDSGSPLSSNGTVVGITSMASCDRELPAVYTRVYSYIQWIRRILQTGESDA